ncbi:uncharacterized protein LOC119696509 isoform X2 [Motacilla alba alba]|uniref:uncharacterized protein LOC119696509 isoform X2 n=1 Tax=Motacilla alba alba TaxID=1094192 RepID=UPI0018D4E6B8|nr:uncharacterized protein LOC119696509 isoform X2 [Motacilla alba alba]
MSVPGSSSAVSTVTFIPPEEQKYDCIFRASLVIPKGFMMHNTGEVALKYSWEKAAESEPVKKPYSTTLMRRFLSYDTVKHCRELLHLLWWEQDHPPEMPDEVQRLWWPDKQQQEQQERSKKLRRSKQNNLSPKRASSSLEIFPDVINELFSISPYHGTIAPGQKQTFHLQFSPKCAGNFKTTLLCRIPNLEPRQKMGQVIVKGTAQEQKIVDEPLE